jgi:WD40 repeat protein
VRGFRGGYFADDGALYADFPKFEQDERTIARLDLTRTDVSSRAEIKEERAVQSGPFVFIVKPARKDGDYQQDVVLEVRDVRTYSSMWSKAFPKEAPEIWMSPETTTIVLSWPVSGSVAQSEIKSDRDLTSRLAALKEKEGDYLLQVLDARTGRALGRLLIETGKGSFRISRVRTSGDWVIISDTENRVLVYSLSTGEQKGKVFGSNAAFSPESKLLCVENESGKLVIYDLTSTEERDRFTFSSPVSLARFSADGKSLFVLTARQTAYVIDLSALSR